MSDASVAPDTSSGDVVEYDGRPEARADGREDGGPLDAVDAPGDALADADTGIAEDAVDAESSVDGGADSTEADVSTDAPTGPIALDCVDTSPSVTSGTMKAPAALDFVALCNGQILLGDRNKNRVVVFDVVSGKESASFALTAAPRDLLLDKARSLLYVSLFPATKLARIDLKTGDVTEIPTTVAVTGLALGPIGMVLAADASYPRSYLRIIDGPKAKETGALALDVEGETALAFDASANHLFVSCVDCTRTYLYDFDSTTPKLSLAQTIDAGCIGTIPLSPDGTRVGVPAGVGYADCHSSDAKVVDGYWTIPKFLRGAVFSEDGSYFGAANDSALLLFDRKTYALLKSTPNSLCSIGRAEKVRFSRGGKLLIALSVCSYPGTASEIAWSAVP